MDDSILESLAEFICGDNRTSSPTYRTGSELTRFFNRAGVSRLMHDGSTRKWWALDALRSCNQNELQHVILRLANPLEYAGDRQTTVKALNSLNRIIELEGLNVYLDGAQPKIGKVQVDFTHELESEAEPEFKPLPPPDFTRLDLEPGVADILLERWKEAEKCVNASACLAGIIIMGSLLEGLLLAVVQRKPQEANQSTCCPTDPVTGKPKLFHEWTLSDMINVAYEKKWIDLDVKKFSHSLREFRNLVHPYQQMAFDVFPDEDTSRICWLVVQAAVNDLARTLTITKKYRP